jgi:Type II secretion system protein C
MNKFDKFSSRGALLWLIPLAALLAYGGKLTDWGRDLVTDDIAWKKVNAQMAANGVVPDIAFNADASPYAVITDRNLFVPWRKPSPPPEPAKPPADPPKPQIRRGIYALTGTMQIGTDTFATVKENATNRTKRVKVGDELQEYKVQEVDNDRVVLAYAGQTEELVLAKYTQSGRAVAPPAQAVPMPPLPPQVPQAGQVPQQQQPGMPAVQPRAQPFQGGAVAPFPPVIPSPQSGGPVPLPAAPPATPVTAVPVAQQPQPEIIDVGELLRRRREARKQ